MTAFALPASSPAARAEINITPLVDVLLVLLVIFMLAAPIATRRLPLSNATACRDCPSPQPPLRLSIKRTGEMYWDGAAVTRAALAANLGAFARSASQRPLEFHVEAGTRYDAFTSALESAQDAGVQRISVSPER